MNIDLTQKDNNLKSARIIKKIIFASCEFLSLFEELLVDGVKSFDKNWATLQDGEPIKVTMV